MKRPTKHLIAATLIAAAPIFSGLAHAADEMKNNTALFGPSEGSHEFQLSGTGNSDRHFDNGGFGITGTYGWYMSRDLELGIRQSVNWASVNNGGDRINGSTRGALDYHFNVTDRFRPFVGANVGVIYGDAVHDTGILGPEGGVKYYFNPTTFIVGQMEYQYLVDSGDDVGNNFDHGAFAYTLGLGFNF